MGQALQSQLLKLEEAFEEAKRAGVAIQEEVKVAVVLRCLSAALHTHFSLQLSEGMTYQELRECLVKWDRAQQRWSRLVSSDDSATEVDRIEKGKSKKGVEKTQKERMVRKAKVAIPTASPRAKATLRTLPTAKGRNPMERARARLHGVHAWSSDGKGKGNQFHGSDVRCWK